MPKYGEEFERRVFQGHIEMLKGQKSDFEEGRRILEDAWNELPEPKYYYNESYLIAIWMLEIGKEFMDEKMILEWIPHVLEAAPERADIGDREESVGEAYYELGDLDKAFEYFSIAAKKSRGGRCFSGRNSKYKKFYLSRK